MALCDPKMCTNILHQVQDDLDVERYSRSCCWAKRLKNRAMKLLGFSVDNDTQRRVLHIAHPWKRGGVRVLRSLESIDKEVICSPNNKTKYCTIVQDTISQEEYLRKISRGKGRREIADRYCYLDGDKK